MARKFLTPIDLSGLELQNAVVQNLPTGSLPASPADGRIAYDSTTDQFKVAINGVWTVLSTGIIGDATTTSKGIVQLAGDLAGTAAAPVVAAGAITDTKVAAANKDGAVGTASMRTLGAGAQQAMPGNRTLDAITAPAADVSFNSHKATNLADPTSNQDAATKNYVDGVAVSGIAWKAPVRAASAAAIPASTYAAGVLTASANGVLPNIDGVSLIVGDRVLVKDHPSNQAYQGIYTVTNLGSVGTPWVMTRATDADIAAELLQATVMVEEGTTNADTLWTSTANAPITVGTTNLPFVLIQSATAIGANAPLVKVGSNIGASTPGAPPPPFTAGTVRIGTIGVARTCDVTIIGDGALTSFTVAHNLGNFPNVRGYTDDGAGNWKDPVELDWTTVDANTITVSFPVAPAATVQYHITLTA